MSGAVGGQKWMPAVTPSHLSHIGVEARRSWCHRIAVMLTTQTIAPVLCIVSYGAQLQYVMIRTPVMRSQHRRKIHTTVPLYETKA